MQIGVCSTADTDGTAQVVQVDHGCLLSCDQIFTFLHHKVILYTIGETIYPGMMSDDSRMGDTSPVPFT